MTRLAISNIAWGNNDDETVYRWMQEYGFTGLEIAPTRIFPTKPYENLTNATKWSRENMVLSSHLFNRFGMVNKKNCSAMILRGKNCLSIQ